MESPLPFKVLACCLRQGQLSPLWCSPTKARSQLSWLWCCRSSYTHFWRITEYQVLPGTLLFLTLALMGLKWLWLHYQKNRNGSTQSPKSKLNSTSLDFGLIVPEHNEKNKDLEEYRIHSSVNLFLENTSISPSYLNLLESALKDNVIKQFLIVLSIC